MRARRSRAGRGRVIAGAVVAALAAASLSAFAQTNSSPFPTWNPYGQSGQAPPSRPPASQPPADRTPPPAAPGSPVIARVQGRPITQAEFDRVAQPYLERLRRELGGGFTPELQKVARFNVLDELVRREILALEVQRQNIVPTVAETDSLLAMDPLFQTNGRFDPAKFNAYKTGAGSNYLQVLPKLREAVAVGKLDQQLRRRFTPTAAQVRAEWAKRSDQVRFSALALLRRDMPTDVEASEAECRAYYDAHPDQFTRRTRVRFRYARLPIAADGDSARAVAEAAQLAAGRTIADSLRDGTLAATSERLLDTGLFEVPSPFLPGVGRLPELSEALAHVDQDTTIRVLGPFSSKDAVIVGLVTEREPKRVPPYREVLADVKRRADMDKRRTQLDADRRAFHAANRERWKAARVQLTRVTLASSAIDVKPAADGEVARWYAQKGRTLFGASDSSKAWTPPLTDSLRTVVRGRLAAEQRDARALDALAKLAVALRGTGDIRSLARASGAAAETLSLVRGGTPDTLFSAPFVDSLIAAGPAARGGVQGPRFFGARAAVWRIDAVDTAYVPAYEQVRARADVEFAEDRRRKDEAEARAWFDAHRGDYRTVDKVILDYVAVPVPLPDSVAVPEADVRRWYDTHTNDYRQEEQVQARHILFMTRGQGPEVEARAKARADSLLAAIRANGGDFAELAKRFSEEPGAAARGGDLGWFGRGRMVKEFEQAAFALKPGEVSPVVKTMFGYHILKVEGRRPAGVKPFDEVRTEVRTLIAQQRGDSTARRAAEVLRRQLAAGGDEKAIAAPRGGVVTTPPVVPADPVANLGVVQDLPAKLPSLVPGRWAPTVFRAGGSYVALRLREKVPPGPATFEEVRARAAEDAKEAKRRAVLEERVADIRRALAAGATLDSLAAPYGGLKDSGMLTSASAFVPVLGNEPRLVQKAFGMKTGEVSDTLQTDAGVAWLRLEEHKTADAEQMKTATAQIETELMRKGYEQWLDERRKAVRVEVLRADLKGPRPLAAR